MTRATLNQYGYSRAAIVQRAQEIYEADPTLTWQQAISASWREATAALLAAQASASRSSVTIAA